MKSIDQLKSERDALDLQIQQAINLERGQAIAKAKELIATFSLTVRDLGLHTTGAVKKAKESGRVGRPAAIKYRDGAGNIWTGRGKMPRWLDAAVKSGKRKEDYLI